MADEIKKYAYVEFHLLVSSYPSHKYYKHMQSYARETHKPVERFQHQRRKTCWHWISTVKVTLKRYTNSRLVTTWLPLAPPAMHYDITAGWQPLFLITLPHTPRHFATVRLLLVLRALWDSWYRINRRRNRAAVAAQRLGNRLFHPILFWNGRK